MRLCSPAPNLTTFDLPPFTSCRRNPRPVKSQPVFEPNLPPAKQVCPQLRASFAHHSQQKSLDDATWFSFVAEPICTTTAADDEVATQRRLTCAP